MDIENKTTWDTKDLRKVFQLVCINEAYTPRRIIVVYGTRIIEYSKGNQRVGVSGVARIGSGWVKMKIPNSILIYESNENHNIRVEKLTELNGKVIKRIAQVLAHELGHNRGLRHREMMRVSFINVDYIDGLIIHRKSKPKNKEKDPIKERYHNLLKKISQWETKSKRAKTYLKKYGDKRKYYEKKYSKERLI